MASTFLMILLLLVGILFLAFLQVALSKKESRLPGLILPMISFLYSLLYLLGMIVPPEGVSVGFSILMVVGWLIFNIPTIIFMGIYFHFQGKQHRSKQLNKMNIQDLD